VFMALFALDAQLAEQCPPVAEALRRAAVIQ
jgi:hypothetical protein